MNYRIKVYGSIPVRDESIIRSDYGGEFFRNVGSLEDVEAFAVGNFVLGADLGHQMLVEDLLLEEIFQQRSQNRVNHQVFIVFHVDAGLASNLGNDFDVVEEFIVVDCLSEIFHKDSPEVLEEILQRMVPLACVDFLFLR